MKLDFCENSDSSKPKVLCVEYDGEISCFELGDLPPAPDDPRKLGIVFPCCVKNKLEGKIGSNTTKLRKTDTEQKNKNYFPIKRIKSKNIKRDGFKECSVPSNTNTTKQDTKQNRLLYVFDKNGLNKVVTFTKANIECADTAELKGGTRENCDQKSPYKNRKKQNTYMNMGNSVRACKSRELRGGILSTDCFCLRRNGLQYDCRRTGCQNNPMCTVLPAPVCEPSRVACITHCSNPHAEELSSICKLRPW